MAADQRGERSAAVSRRADAQRRSTLWSGVLVARFLLVFAWMCLLPSLSWAQGEWISRIDDDRNGMIEPDEVSDRARRYLEEFARPYGLRLTRPISVRLLEKAARQYYARRDRDDEDGPRLAPGVDTIRGFSTDEDQSLIPDFGSASIRYPYTAEDLEEAEELLDRYDRDDDGLIDSDEARRVRWRGSNPNQFDFDRNGKLNRLELAQRYARRRIGERLSELAIAPRLENDRDDDGDRRRDWRSRGRAGRSRDGDRGAASLAESILERYDSDRDEQLDSEEMAAVGLPIAVIDYDRSGGVDDDELAKYLFVTMENQAEQMQEAIPTWFFERDLDGDSQVVMAEFTDDWSKEKFDEFALFDTNGDGIITTNEVLTSKQVAGGRFRNSQAKVLLPRSTIVSEIEVDKDFLIGDLNVELAISHTYTSHLDGYLIGPDGERVELFTGVGGSDDHFDNTIFDDEARQDITRARPPFEGSFRPEEIRKRRPGLSRYKGKNLKGVWQLMIRASRSQRSGLLHGWSLIVEPAREQVEELASERARTSERVEGGEDEAPDGKPNDESESRRQWDRSRSGRRDR